MKFFIVVLLLIVTVNISAKDFGPWKPDVIVDENRHRHFSSKKSIYNGVQGGAYYMIRFFQVVISPQDGPSCRFDPVCSVYGREAVEKHGALVGSFLAGDRMIRCNPFNKPGRDPVPDVVFSGNDVQEKK